LQKVYFFIQRTRLCFGAVLGMVLFLFMVNVSCPHSEVQMDCRQQMPVLIVDPITIHVGDSLHATFKWCETDSATLFVYNVSWSPAGKKKFTTQPGENKVDLELRRRTPGVYYAYLEIENGTFKQRSSLVKFTVLR
jgi:hypothetical protein